MSYNKKIWANGDLITKEGMNNIEYGIYDAHDKINAINNKVEENTTDTNTAKQDISDIKLQIGTEELTTTSKKIKGAINELSSQIKDIVKNNKIKSLLDYKHLVVDSDWTSVFKQVAQDIGVEYNVLYIPFGQYEITEVIWFENKNNISILSDFATIKNIVQDNANSKAGTFYFRNSDGIYLDKIIHQGIDSQKPITALNGGRYGLMFHNCSNIYVHQNKFFDFADNALLVGRESNTDVNKIGGCKYVYVDSCVFDNFWQTSTTTMGCEEYHFINNKVRNVYGSCKFAQRYDLGGRLIIQGNTIEGAIDFSNDTTKVSKGFEINNYKNIIIANNIIRKMSVGIWLANNGRADDDRYTLIENVSIHGNLISNFNSYGICLYHSGVTMPDGSKGIWENISIKDNTVQNTDSALGNGSALYVRGNELVGLDITNNIIDTIGNNIYIVSTKVKDSEGNFVYPNNYYNVTGNTLICTGTNCKNIVFSPESTCPSLIFSNNVCTAYKGENLYGCTTDSYMENALIDSNVFNQFGAFANIQSNMKKTTLSNNIFNNVSNLGINILYGKADTVTWQKVINNRFNTSGVGIRTTGNGTLYTFANTYNSKTMTISNGVTHTTIAE